MTLCFRVDALSGRAIIGTEIIVCREKMPSNEKSINKTLGTQRKLLLASVLLLVCFLAIAAAFLSGTFDGINSAANRWAAGIQTHGLTQAADAISFWFDTTILLALTIPAAGLLLYRGYKLNAGLLIGAMGVDALLLQVCKTAVASPRPLNALIVEGNSSFPSGHVTSTIVFAAMLSYFAWQDRRTISKLCTAAVGPVLIVVVAFDRLYLNVHWLSDILAAPFLALFIVAATMLVMQYLTGWYSRKHSNIKSASLKGLFNLKTATLYGRAITNTQQTIGSDS
jgi:membrane-associated phospholipid phosphatase